MEINKELQREMFKQLGSIKYHGDSAEEQPFFNELRTRKQNGESFRLEDISPIMLRKLWWEEICMDGEIASLFDELTEKDIRDYRYKVGVKFNQMDFLDGISKER